MLSPASVVQISISKGGVPKVAVPSADVTRLGLKGDFHAHPRVHGGPKKAVLLVTAEGIEELIAAGEGHLWYAAATRGPEPSTSDSISTAPGQVREVLKSLI